MIVKMGYLAYRMSHFKSCTEIFLQRSRKKCFRQKLFGLKRSIKKEYHWF